MTRALLSAVLLFTFAGCDHQIGTIDLPQGRTELAGEQVTSNLRSVFAVSDSEVYLVGEGGTVARFNGTALERVQVPGVTENDMLVDVAAADSGQVVAIGGTPQETSLVVTLNGGSWSSRTGIEGLENFHPARLLSTLHFGFENPKRVLLAGGVLEDGYLDGYVSSFAAGSFTPFTLPSTYAYLEDVTGIGATFYFRHVQGILAVDGGGGTDFASPPINLNTPLLGLSEGRSKYLFGFDSEGNFYTQQAGQWTSTQTEAMFVQALDGRAINDLYAVGIEGRFFHFDGTIWTALESGTTEHLRDVHVLPNGHVYVVGDNGTFFVYVP